jgi:hypothetical protein
MVSVSAVLELLALGLLAAGLVLRSAPLLFCRLVSHLLVRAGLLVAGLVLRSAMVSVSAVLELLVAGLAPQEVGLGDDVQL